MWSLNKEAFLSKSIVIVMILNFYHTQKWPLPLKRTIQSQMCTVQHWSLTLKQKTSQGPRLDNPTLIRTRYSYEVLWLRLRKRLLYFSQLIFSSSSFHCIRLFVYSGEIIIWNKLLTFFMNENCHVTQRFFIIWTELYLSQHTLISSFHFLFV